jgi:NADPH2:quinone reductase
MKAVVYRDYGTPDVLKVEEVPRPTPGPREVIIEVHATTVTAADCMMRRGDTVMSRLIIGMLRPKPRYRIMGLELAGVVVEAGSRVTRFAPGDRVFGFAGFSVGAHAQYIRMPEAGSLAREPEGLSFEEAAAIVDGPTTAMYFIEQRARVRSGDKVLIIGASGSIGSAAVQLAALAGAEVTAVCSGKNAALVRSLGATEVIDYTHEDFTQNGQTYDVIFDTLGKSSYFHARASLTPNGMYLLAQGGLSSYLLSGFTRLFCKKKCIFGMSVEKNAALRRIGELIEDGDFQPVIDRRYDLDEIALAHGYVDKGHKRGNVVVTVPHSGLLNSAALAR